MILSHMVNISKALNETEMLTILKTKEKECFGDDKPETDTYTSDYTFHCIVIGFDFICLIVNMIIARKVLKIVKCSNPRVTLLMIFINLTILTNMIQHTIVVYYLYYLIEKENGKDNEQLETFRKSKICFIEIESLLFTITIIINANMWAFNFIRLREMASKSTNQFGI